MMEQDHFKHLHENDTYIRPEDFPVVDDLLDWLIDKQRQGWKMVDSIPRLQNMKGFMRGADRKSTRLNSSHGYISYAVFCLKKKKNKEFRNCFSSTQRCRSMVM